MKSKFIDFYVENGWYIFPLKKISKTPDPKYAPNGFKNADVNPDKIKLWPEDDNIGIATGSNSNLYVLDMDIDKTSGECIGCNSIEEYLKKLGIKMKDIQTYTIKTGSGGVHLYFRLNEEQKQRVESLGKALGSKIGIFPHVDLKGDGGYVVAPPSIHPNGNAYSVLFDNPIQEMPEWLLQLFILENVKKENDDRKEIDSRGPMHLSSANRAKLSSVFIKIYSPSYGFGHSMLLAFSGALAMRGVPIEETWDILSMAAKNGNLTGVEKTQVSDTYKRYSQNSPISGLTTIISLMEEHKDKYNEELVSKIKSAFNFIFLIGEEKWKYFLKGNERSKFQKYILCTDSAVSLVTVSEKNDDENTDLTTIFNAPLELVKSWISEGDEENQIKFEFKLGNVHYMGTKKEVSTAITDSGLTGINPVHIQMAVAACVEQAFVLGNIDVKKTFEAIGMYSDEKGKIFSIYKTNSLKGTEPWFVYKRYKPYLGELKKDMQQFNSLSSYFDEKTLGIMFGWSALAPLSYILRGEGNFFWPLIIMKGPKGTGKTTLGELFTRYLYGVEAGGPADVTSDFRLLDFITGTTFPRLIDESENAKFEGSRFSIKISTTFKEAAEKQIVGNRGNVDKTKRIYPARTPLLLAGNKIELEDPALLARSIILSSSIENTVNSSNRRVFSTLLKGINKGSGNKLMDYISDHYTVADIINNIKSIDFGLNFSDSRREDFYAMIYFGLRIWDEFLSANEIKFNLSHLLDNNNFIKLINSIEVENNEESTDRQGILSFIDWVRHKIDMIESLAAGESREPVEYFSLISIMKKEKENERDWAYVTSAALSRAKKDLPNMRESSLAELADSLSRFYNIPKERFYNRKAKWISKHPAKVVRIPLDDPSIVDFGGGYVGKPSDSPPPNSKPNQPNQDLTTPGYAISSSETKAQTTTLTKKNEKDVFLKNDDEDEDVFFKNDKKFGYVVRSEKNNIENKENTGYKDLTKNLTKPNQPNHFLPFIRRITSTEFNPEPAKYEVGKYYLFSEEAAEKFWKCSDLVSSHELKYGDPDLYSEYLSYYNTVQMRIKKDLPAFETVYGGRLPPFHKNDIAHIPECVARIFIEHEFGVEIKVGNEKKAQ